ncbi:MAG TPA: DEAD/DEAH box helicase [bacterium]|nr:DEAD/DEAH box helicase [bacterium]
MTDLLPPVAFGLPEKFVDWRTDQDEAIFSIINNEKRFITQVAPCGFGKSLVYVAAAVFKGERSILLTSTKGLQTQLLNDFETMGAVDIRGRNAYPCNLVKDGTRCDQGPCIAGVKCGLKDEGRCLYFKQVKKAQKAKIVITNYAYWMTNSKYALEGLGDFDFMVCDEAHGVPNSVSAFLTVTLERSDVVVETILPSENVLHQMSIRAWRQWALSYEQRIAKEIELLSATVREGGGKTSRRRLSKLKSVKTNLATISNMQDDWAIDIGKFVISFAPVWPAPYCEESLFLNVNRILLTSASVCEKTVNMLGVSFEDNIIQEYAHTFPLENRLLTHIPHNPPVRMNRHTTDMQMRQWLTKIDQIIKGRLDRNGIVHTVSYDRRNLVITHSKHKEYMVTHKRLDTEKVVERFKRMKSPAILVSPSMSTGWDFPDDTCRYQIIGKIAYPDTRNVIVKARTKDDPEYTSYEAMQQLVQTCGRPVRSATDWAENFIIDDNIGWFIKRYGKFAPKWFTEAIRKSARIPTSPKIKKV